MSAVRFCDELDFAVGWIHPEPDWMQRAGPRGAQRRRRLGDRPARRRRGGGARSASSASRPASCSCWIVTRATARSSPSGSACRCHVVPFGGVRRRAVRGRDGPAAADAGRRSRCGSRRSATLVCADVLANAARLHRPVRAGRRASLAAPAPARRVLRRFDRCTCCSATARACTARTRPSRSPTRCAAPGCATRSSRSAALRTLIGR